jgi:glycosyltransferase involved in cell wall biosynthesis
MYKLSIIIPVYNTEKYVKRCIESILNSKLPNEFKDKIELVVVNDGSKDNSENIINAIITRKKYGRNFDIQYYSKKNGGLSDARNYGVERAKGEYITFVDSDDYVSDSLYLDVLDLLSKENKKDDKVDVIKIKCKKVDEEGTLIEQFNGPIFNNKNGNEAFDLLFSKDKLIEPAWLYIINTEYYKYNKFKFKKNMYHEDFGLTPLIIAKANRMYSIENYGYNYVQTNGESITRQNSDAKNMKRAEDLLKHYDFLVEEINKDKNIEEKTRENIKIMLTNSIILEIDNLNTNEQKRNYIIEIKRRKMLDNIKVRNFKQFLKRIILNINVNLYLKLRNK